ncbi:MAG: ankyrin repeat domain-containing protein [Synergistaceae bacterium]|jgi:ankyrin repeat protein|nr:ankyrin repeat domain-containing protein [Synergistaceae bacterium]
MIPERTRFAFVFVLIFAAVLALAFFAPARTVFSYDFAAVCARGDVAAVRDLLFYGTDPDERDEQGNTPLMRTVRAGVTAPLSMHIKLVDLLTGAGADVNAAAEVSPPPKGDRGNPERTMAPLHWAVEKGANFLEMTLLLLEKGADPNLSGALGRPLHIAARSERAGAEHIALLLRWGADARLTDQWGLDPLAEAVIAPRPDAGKVRLLLEAGADPNAEFDWGDFGKINVLIAAAVNGTPDIVLLLLDNGALKFLESEKGLTAYQYAIEAGREDNAELLK